MKFIFLTKDYFNRHPSSEFPEMLRKSNRPYVQITIPCNHQLWAIPLRSYINHEFAFWSNKKELCGLDFTKAVPIELKDIDTTHSPIIRRHEFNALKGKDYDLITVDEHRIQTTIDVYFQWKTLDIMLSTLSTRGINFPSEISENIVCYTCGYFLNKGSSGDAIDPNGNRIIEIKGSSSTGPSSFSPSFEDEKGRGTLFFEILRIIKAKRPKAILLENVKNLVSHDNGNTFRVILEALKDAGYHVRYAVLNAMEYGNIPQNRERIYIVGFRTKKVFEKFTFPEPIPLKKTIHDVIDFINPVDEKYLYIKGKYKGDIYDKLVVAMDDSNAVYQWRRKYVRKNMSGVVPTLTANQGEGGHNVCLVKTKQGIRKMTPKECFNTQGFPESFVLPDIADGRLYKQAGNSVCVSVVQRIAEQMLVAMK